MYRRDLLKGAGAAIGGAALLSCRYRDRRPTSRAARMRPLACRSIRRNSRRHAALLSRLGQRRAAGVHQRLGAHVRLLGYQMAPLSDSGLRCIAYDRRGHGRSSDPGRGFDYDTLADDLAAVLDALDLKNVTLVTHSMAGGEAVRYLSRHGSKRVARVALIAATLPFLTKTADNPDGIDPAVFENARRNVLLRDFPKALRDNMRPFGVAETSDAMLDWIGELMLRCSMKALVECNRALTVDRFPRRAGEDRCADA